MRNPTANFDNAFNEEPTRKSTPRKPGATSRNGTSRKKKRGPSFRDTLHKVARYGAIGMSAILAVAIMCNALVMQKGRHPAPLFGTALGSGSNTVLLPPVRTPAPTRASAFEGATQTRTSEKPALGAATKPDPSALSGSPDAFTAADPIGRLLLEETIAAPGPNAETKTIMGAQRALVKLGFPLKPNGTLGPQTTKAIERFEKSRHLPAKGELTPRLVKILAAESGIRID